MSELIPNILALDKGLDLQSPKLTAPPGSVLDSLNYEQVDFQGQKRIDGYTRYDGSPLSAVKDVYLVHGLSYIDYGTYRLALNYNDVPYGVVTDVSTNPPFNNAIAVFDEAALTEEYNGVWASASSDYANDPDEHQALVNEVNQYLRNRVEDLPGPISGLHWFRDRLYAVVDIENYYGGDSRIDGAGNASLFVSRSIQQVLEEDNGPYDFGWKFVHQGWWVDFKDGLVKSGKLTSKNQNRQNVGVQGPTSTEGAAGSPQLLQQRMTITNLPTQVNGWKTSTSPQVYNIEASALLDEDATYIYADAFVSWDGGSRTITAPGIAGTDLVEYSPTNTVEVT